MFYVQIPSLIVDHSLVMVSDRRFTEMWWWCKLPMWDGNIGSSIKKKRVSFSLSHMAPACQKEYAWKYIFVYHASIQVPKHNSLKLFRPSDTNVSEKFLLIFWRSQKSECKPLLAHLQSKMHDLEKIKQSLPDIIPEVSQITNLSRDIRLSWNPRILMGLAPDMSKCS